MNETISDRERIDVIGRLRLALDELEACREMARLVPEVRTNCVYALPHARSPLEVAGVDGRVTVVEGMPKAAGNIRFGASSHLARLVIELMKTDPDARAAINFANNPPFSRWLTGSGIREGKAVAGISRRDEPESIRDREGGSMEWKAQEAVRACGGKVPRIICDSGGMGKEPVCIIVGKEPVSIARELCGIARAWDDART